MRPTSVDETPLRGEEPGSYVERMAREKGQALKASRVLAADTIVHAEGRILQKPADAEDAQRCLRFLSGRSHQVTTAFSLHEDGLLVHLESVSTQVHFRELSAAEIRAYVASGEPMDKAGAYGIQGGASGYVLSLQGSYTSVVGLPLAQVLLALRARGWVVRAGAAS